MLSKLLLTTPTHTDFIGLIFTFSHAKKLPANRSLSILCTDISLEFTSLEHLTSPRSHHCRWLRLLFRKQFSWPSLPIRMSRCVIQWLNC